MHPSEKPENELQAQPKPPVPPRNEPVFYDADSRRWPRFLRFARTVGLLSLVGTVLLVASLIALPLMPRTALPRVTAEKDRGNPEPVMGNLERRQLGVKQARDRRALLRIEAQTQREQRERLRQIQAELEKEKNGASPVRKTPVVAGFYVPWEETSRASTHRNIAALTHFVPEWLHLKPAGSLFTAPKQRGFEDKRESLDRRDVTPFVREHGVPIVPLLNNYTSPRRSEEGLGSWDPKAVHQIISNPKARATLITQLRDFLLAERFQGINIDFEEIPDEDRDNLSLFMQELAAAFRPHNLLVTQCVEMERDAFDMPALAVACDWVVPMLYDEHTGETGPGPVASAMWVHDHLQQLLRQIPAEKVVLGVGNHGYDWNLTTKSATNVTFQSAIIQAKENQPDAVVQLDKQSLNPTFRYTDYVADADGKERPEKHVVWMQDAVSVYNILSKARPLGIRGSALWYLGSEDPSLWTFYDQHKWKDDWTPLIRNGSLDTISYGNVAEINFEGEGELLQPLAAPAEGKRRLMLDAKTGLITAQEYLKDPVTGAPLMPSSYVVRRYAGGLGNPQKKIVLTFDDGPDPEWTPQILDILKRYNVPAAFFVVGKQAEAYPNLVRRMWDEGHEIGNHSWSHPDLFLLSPEAQQLQLTLTQRVVQAVTGHSTTLFRPPYGGDPEPTTAHEVGPMLAAAGMNYVTVGEKNDPQDWRLFAYKPGTEFVDNLTPRTGEEMARSVIVNRDEGSIVLLHDAGGDRTRTLEALPLIITELQKLGYKFVTVSDLMGKSRAELMPPVTGRDTLLAGADRYVFLTAYFFQRLLTTLFTLSLLLGISRVVLFVGLALVQWVRERGRVFPVGFAPPVSVIIAAYNEEKVIVRTIQTLLDSDYPHLEIVVVDDGSKDATSQVVTEKYGSTPQVTVLRKENGGKASALNRGIEMATGEILISLDADTLFARDTISRLVRHFHDPKVGAVAGNVRVGNTVNVWTRLQALEYITSQNFDRRSYDLLNCITVVPGAVGALRRTALEQAGGYTHDTLAEDTDLTWKIRRLDWRIANDNTAMAYTEAPESLRNLAKQRFRWAYGTLQCLWKHRAALGRHGAFGIVAMPSLWLYQILFPAVSPFMDIAVVWSLFAGNYRHVAGFYFLMFGVELLAALLAVWMDKANGRLLPWLFFQRFLYRQLMYYVVLKSLLTAIRGGAVGWGKFERTGTVRVESKPS